MHGTTRSLLLCGWVFAVACDDAGKLDETMTGELGRQDGDDGSDGSDGGDDVNEDADGDGFSAEEDCDDARADVNPAATEICDGIDNDCDGAIDPSSSSDANEWFFDGDGDGFGNATVSERACTPPADHVDNPDDCDDNDANIHPEAAEVCNLFDDDCDGLIDDDDDSLDTSTAEAFFLDADSDGYGDASAPIMACELPSGHADNADDCNDDSDQARPDGSEICDDLDNDCNGLIDDDDPDVDLSTTRVFYLDDDGDGYGRNNATTLGCSLPSGYSIDDTDCDDEDAAINPGATEVCDDDDTDEDCDRSWDDYDASVDLSTGTTWYADGDKDGYGDTTDSGTVYCDDPSTATDTFVIDATDCDDTDAAINPAATEVCDDDDTDENCNGVADDDDSSVDTTTATSWYIDVDDDGYGDEDAASTLACDDPSTATDTYRTDATDCDDGDAAINPGATEVCDASNTDEDCNGLADNDDPDSTGTSTWYPDSDGDTFGDLSDAGTESCDDPSTSSASFVSDNTDCDDDDIDVNPSATEICDDEDTDEDCDGMADDADSSVDSATQSDWYPDSDGDSFGDETAAATAACDDPGTSSSPYVTDNTDCDDAADSINPAATEVCDASDTDEDCNGLADDGDSGVDTTTATRWHIDGDSDGYGDDTDAGSLFCDDPSTASTDYAANDSDCDDAAGSINPDATEVCDANDTDEDCNGLADNDDPGADTASTGTDYYPDADEDGYGDSSATATAYCDDPTTGSDWWTTDLTDCDDGNEDINPGATELCNGVDDDCDAVTIEDGTVSFVDSTGTTDLTSSWGAGSSSSAVSWSASSDGTLFVCADTWYVNLTIDGHDVDIQGVDGSATCILDGAEDGRVVAVVDATASVSGVTIQRGDASYGGGIYVENSTLTGSDITVTDNTASVDGGGIFAYYSALDLSDCTVDSNEAGYDGGGLTTEDGSTTAINGCSITSNVAGRYGGGIIFDTTTGAQTIASSDISSNIAASYGGGIECLDVSSALTITDSTLNTNAASYYYGGAIDADNCELELDEVGFDGNSAVRGGAIYIDSSFDAVDVDITNSSVSYAGGGIYLTLSSGESCTMSGGSIEDNSAGSYGGGVYASLSGTATYDAASTDFSGNSPYSVRVAYIGNYTYGSAASFACDSSGCR